jgi:hypothetical protein
MTTNTKQWPRKSYSSSSWHRLSVTEGDNGERWTIVWDTQQRPGSEGRSIAREKLESGALDRARHMVRMGFVVYEIREPKGTLHLTGDALRQRLGPPVAVPRAFRSA